MYGAPHGWGANLLAYNTKDVTPAPTSWSVIYDPASTRARSRSTTIRSRSPTRRCTCKATQPDLKITNVYELDQKQFDAAVALLKKQRPLIGQFWADVTKQQQGFTQGDLQVGSIWQYTANLLTADKQPVKTTVPKEGATGWSDTWMLSSKAEHPELHAQVDELHPDAEGAGAGGGVVRRGAGQPQGLRRDHGQDALRHVQRQGQGVLRQDRVLGDADAQLPRRPRQRLRGLLQVGPGLDRDQGLTAASGGRRPRDACPPSPHPRLTRARRAIRPLAGLFWRIRSLQVGSLLAAPLGWLGIVYLGSLVVLLITAFWTLNDFTGLIVKGFSLDNFKPIFTEPVYRRIVLRTVSLAALVTVTDILLAFPIAFFMARVAGARTKGLLVVAVLMPLWASYLVKVYSWRTMLVDERRHQLVPRPARPARARRPATSACGSSMAYLWLPYMILPLYAGLERIHDSLLDASGDLGARPWRTFRSVVLPLALPAIVAGSIFTFSLTLGDYITPQLVSNTQFIGNVVYANVGIANNLPLASAFATVPIVIMLVYLLIARRLGAFEAL